MSVEQWKYKFLYPFGNIAPIVDKNENVAGPNGNVAASNESDGEFNNKAFTRLVSSKYLFPLEMVHKNEWLKELQTPINITAEDIVRDLYKFVKDFPVEIIPHMTEDEII